MAEKHRIGIVGVGAIAGLHARAIGDIPGAELVAFSNGVEPRASQFREEFGHVVEQEPVEASLGVPTGVG